MRIELFKTRLFKKRTNVFNKPYIYYLLTFIIKLKDPNINAKKIAWMTFFLIETSYCWFYFSLMASHSLLLNLIFFIASSQKLYETTLNINFAEIKHKNQGSKWTTSAIVNFVYFENLINILRWIAQVYGSVFGKSLKEKICIKLGNESTNLNNNEKQPEIAIFGDFGHWVLMNDQQIQKQITNRK